MAALADLCSGLEPLADLILVGSDGVEFPVHKFILAKYSMLFRDMFSSADSSSLNPEQKNGSPELPRLQLSDMPGKDLEVFLTCFHLGAGTGTVSPFKVGVTEQALLASPKNILLVERVVRCCKKGAKVIWHV